MDFFDKLRPFTLLVLRLALAVIFIFHGYQKYAHGIFGVKAYMESLGLPAFFAYISIGLETCGGALLILGLLTRPVAFLLAFEMAIAVWKAHLGQGIGAVPQYEFAMICGAASLALASVGAGSVSLDQLFFGRGGKSR